MTRAALTLLGFACLGACAGAGTRATQAAPPASASACSHGSLSRPGESAASPGGAIRGTVRSVVTGHPLSDVTIVATSPSLQDSALELTDMDGSYAFEHLPPGTYEVVFYYGELQERRGNVDVRVDQVTPVAVRFNDSNPALAPTLSTCGVP